MDKDFNNIYKALSLALIDDFKGFLADGTKRIEVHANELHFHVAYREMSKIPGWKYVSGTGQNPIVEYMEEKRAIYITKIPLSSDNTKFQRTVAYLTDVYSDLVEYKSVKQPAYLVLRKIALGMGYDIDEYTLDKNAQTKARTPVSIENYKANIVVKKTAKDSPKRSIRPGDKPVFDRDNNLLGFISNGKFVDKSNYPRYSSIPSPFSLRNDDNESR